MMFFYCLKMFVGFVVNVFMKYNIVWCFKFIGFLRDGVGDGVGIGIGVLEGVGDGVRVFKGGDFCGGGKFGCDWGVGRGGIGSVGDLEDGCRRGSGGVEVGGSCVGVWICCKGGGFGCWGIICCDGFCKRCFEIIFFNL